MRFGLVAFLALLSPIIANAQTPNAESSPDSAPKIALRLTPEKATIRPGEKLKLRVELWNVGSTDVIIAQNIDETFGNSELRLLLEAGSIREAGGGFVADFIPGPTPDFEKTFVSNWLTLNQGHFYGTYVYMDPMDYPHLRKSGQYKVRAEYISRGISSTPGWDGGYLKQQDVERLPFISFKGTVNSNIVKIVVSAPKTIKK